jgi:hypothetical protein
MRTNLTSLSMIVMGGIAAAAIAVAPSAVAATPGVSTLPVPDSMSCAAAGDAATVCQGPGNAQISASPTTVSGPQYPYLGGLGIYHHGHGS